MACLAGRMPLRQGKDADIIVDDIPYRLDTLPQLKALANMCGHAGFRFANYEATLIRLEAVHREYLRLQTEEKKAARLAR